MSAANIALLGANSSLVGMGSSRGGSGGWSTGRDFSEGPSTMDRAMIAADRFADRKPKTAFAALAVGVTATIGILAYAGGSAELAYKANAVASSPAVHVAVIDSGVARDDYGLPNLKVIAIQDANGRGGVVDSSTKPSRGAQATSEMISEMREMTLNPIVVHAYDPFVKGADGRTTIDVEAIRRIAPALARNGVKVALTPYAIPDGKEGRELGRIMKASGIAVFSQTSDRGQPMAPGTITVGAKTDLQTRPLSPSNFQVGTDGISAVSRMAGHGVIYANQMPEAKGSQALAYEIQNRIASGGKLVAMRRKGHHVTTVDYGTMVKVQDPAKAMPTLAKGPGMGTDGAARMTALSRGPSSGAALRPSGATRDGGRD